MKKGRPKVTDKALVGSIRLTEKEWKQLTLLGRAKWIRTKLAEEKAK